MAGWADFEGAEPEMAAAGQALLCQFGPGLGYIATVRKDGGPRVHPCCPIISDGSLWVFVLSGSPKGADLLRDGRYALHTFPKPELDAEFYLTGTVTALAANPTRTPLPPPTRP